MSQSAAAEYIISLKPVPGSGGLLVRWECTCGKHGPGRKRPIVAAKSAFRHADQTGHQLRRHGDTVMPTINLN